MKREFVIGNALVAMAAALVTGVISDKIVEDLFEHGANAGDMWKQAAFILLVPAAFATITLALPGRGDEWLPFVVVAGVAAFAMAYAAVREITNGLDMNDADKIAMRAWYGVMYFGGGMLIPLAVALRQSCVQRPQSPNPAA